MIELQGKIPLTYFKILCKKNFFLSFLFLLSMGVDILHAGRNFSKLLVSLSNPCQKKPSFQSFLVIFRHGLQKDTTNLVQCLNACEISGPTCKREKEGPKKIPYKIFSSLEYSFYWFLVVFSILLVYFQYLLVVFSSFQQFFF